jgi:hypothetical protein
VGVSKGADGRIIGDPRVLWYEEMEKVVGVGQSPQVSHHTGQSPQVSHHRSVTGQLLHAGVLSEGCTE